MNRQANKSSVISACCKECDEARWEFFQDQKGLWKWIQMDKDGVFQKAALKAFSGYGECVGNAIEWGFRYECKIIFVPDPV